VSRGREEREEGSGPTRRFWERSRWVREEQGRREEEGRVELMKL